MSTEGTEKDKNIMTEAAAEESAAETETQSEEESAVQTEPQSAEESAVGTIEQPPEESAAEKENTSEETPEQEAARKKKRKIKIAAGAAAVLLIAYFAYSGWVKFPWMTNRYFLQHGFLAKQSWIQDDGKYSYTDAKGRMVTGLRNIDGSQYYFDTETGVMQTGWVTEEGSKEKMYFQPGSGKAPDGWAEIEGNVYYFSEDAVMQTGWQTVDGKKYYMDEKGCRCTGWQTIDGEEYYLDEDGAMQTGWVKVDGNTYRMDSQGHKCTGRQTVDGKEYFFDNDGVMRTGWTQVEGKRYYYGSDGSMQTGLITVDKEKFYLGEDGAVDPGWHEDDDGSFYVCADGFVADPRDGTGNYGRLIVRNVGIDVLLYTGNSRDDYQTIVDEENSALVVQERRDLEPVIADRRSQGFDLSGVAENSGACVVYADGTVQEFKCTRTTVAHNLGTDVVDDLEMSIWRQNTGGLAAYSSAGTENAEEVIAVFWEPVTEEENTSEEGSENEEGSEDEEGSENEEGGNSESEESGNE